jgi:hypothetical protein
LTCQPGPDTRPRRSRSATAIITIGVPSKKAAPEEVLRSGEPVTEVAAIGMGTAMVMIIVVVIIDDDRHHFTIEMLIL